MPQLLKQYAGICTTLVALLPPLGEALRRQAAAWPKRLSEHELLGDAGLAAIAGNPLLQQLMQSIPVQDIAFERLLTSLRSLLLNEHDPRADDSRRRAGFRLRAREAMLHQ